jgi:SnoaL-like domain
MIARTDDIIAIQQVLARYCCGIDRLDADLIRGVYWPEATDDHGPFVGGREDFIEWVMREMAARHSVTGHALNQSHFEFRDNRAAVETHFGVRSFPRGVEPPQFRVLSGRYLDVMEKRGEEWRILSRVTIYDSGGNADALPMDNFPHVEGSRTRADPSYAIWDTLNGPLPRTAGPA